MKKKAKVEKKNLMVKDLALKNSATRNVKGGQEVPPSPRSK
jgi:hypothetical protein